MKKLILILAVAVAFVGYSAAGWALITPNEAGGNPEVYQAINYVFEMAGYSPIVPGGLTSNVQADAYQVVGPNSYWNDFGGGLSSNFAAIGITANNINTLGVYPYGNPAGVDYVMLPQTGYGYLGTGDQNTVIAVGDNPFPSATNSGSSTAPFPGAVNTMAGLDFGFALNSQDGTNETWYSDPNLNSDKIDHMLVYYLPQLEGVKFWVDLDGDGVGDQEITFTKDTYLLAFEDRKYGHPSFDGDYNDTIFLVTRVTPIPEPMSLMLIGTGLLGLLGLRRKLS